MSATAAEVGVGREVICADGWRVTMHVEVRRGPICKGQIVSARDLPTECQQQCFSGSPHSTRATMSDRTERQVTSEAADEATGTRTVSDILSTLGSGFLSSLASGRGAIRESWAVDKIGLWWPGSVGEHSLTANPRLCLSLSDGSRPAHCQRPFPPRRAQAGGGTDRGGFSEQTHGRAGYFE